MSFMTCHKCLKSYTGGFLGGEQCPHCAYAKSLEPQPAQDNQEAAEQAAEKYRESKRINGVSSSQRAEDFLAGAKWQKAECEELLRHREFQCKHLETKLTEAEKAALQAEVERLKREIENINEAHQHACMIRRRGRE